MPAKQGYASAAPLLQLSKTGAYTGSAKVATGSVNSATVFVRSAPHLKRMSGLLGSVLPAASSANGILRTQIIYVDQPSVDMSFQLRAVDTHSTRTQPVPVEVKATLTTNGKEYEEKNQVNCGGPASGVCAATLSVKPMFQHLTGNSDEEATVHYRIKGDQAWQKLGTVVLKRPAAKLSTTVVDTVYARLPSKPLFALNTFRVEIRSRFRKYLKTAGVEITVSAGLELVGSQFPMSPDGDDVFASTNKNLLQDKDKIHALVAGRKDGKTAELQKDPTDELLFTVDVRVQAGSNFNSRTVQITKLHDLNDVGGSPLTPSTMAVIESRDGVIDAKPASVYIETDRLVGMFGYIDGPTEVLNTAVISKTPVQIPIKFVGVYVLMRRETTLQGAQCSTTFNSAISLDGCNVVLSGSETAGAREASVGATLDKLSCTVPLRIFWPNTVLLSSELEGVHPVAGWLDAADKKCKALRYQRSYITATATFIDGSGVSIKDYDVSSLVHLQTNDTQISKIGSDAAAKWFEGMSPGGKQVLVSAVGAGNTILATKTIRVADQSPSSQLNVIGLDAILLSSLGQLSVSCTSPSSCTSSGKYVRDSELAITVGGYQTRELKFERDSMDVVVSAVCPENCSRLLPHLPNCFVRHKILLLHATRRSCLHV